MAYRAGEYSELCTECRTPAREACPRCGDPLCSAHLPGSERRCFTCEALYLRRETDWIRRVVVALVVLAAAVMTLGAIAVHLAKNGFITGREAALAPVILFGGIIALAVSFALPPLIRRAVRRRFLAE